ncbi:alternate-type signal peptide domain-containing protein [Micrococcales bacterium 31B]|nr:alternate-type signal peptide domain-containing protein [Micrococcales bacterium 31B]
MKKLTKAALAGAAAVTLLLSTGGTLAFWGERQAIADAKITAGQLKVVANGTPTWKLLRPGDAETAAGTAVADITAVRPVPGDRLVYTGNFNVAAQGNNLSIKAAVESGSIAAATSSAADVEIAKFLTATSKVSINGTETNSATIDHLSDTQTTYPVSVTVTLTWPWGTAGVDNAAMLGAVNLSGFAVAISQQGETTTTP